MSYTDQIPVTNVTPTAVVAKSYCRHIRVSENRGIAGWGSVDFLIYKPTQGQPASSVLPVRIQAGAQYTFDAPDCQYKPLDVAGYVAMATVRTTTFDQDEDEK